MGREQFLSHTSRVELQEKRIVGGTSVSSIVVRAGTGDTEGACAAHLKPTDHGRNNARDESSVTFTRNLKRFLAEGPAVVDACAGVCRSGYHARLGEVEREC